MSEEALEWSYREELDEKLMASLAEMKDLSLEKAMDLYYHSRIARLIGEGAQGIQYLDVKVLIQMMLENEPELFENDQFEIN